MTNVGTEPEIQLALCADCAIPPFPWASTVETALVLQQSALEHRRASLLRAGALLQSPLAFVSTASRVLAPGMTLHPGTSTFPLIPPPCPHTTLGPATQTPWGQPPPCLLNAVFPPGSQLVLPAALPRMPMVAGDGGSGPSEAGNFSVISPAAADGRPVQPPHSEPVLFNQAPLNWSAMGGLCEATQHPTALLLPGSSVQKLVQPVPTTVHTQAGQGGYCPDLHPVGPPPPATQPAPVMLFPVHPGPEPPGGDPQCGTAASQAKASLKASRNPTSVYMNFRRWQRYKALAQRHCPQSPDAEALSCFLM